MMIVRITYKNFQMKYYDGELQITCELDGKFYTRVYTLEGVEWIHSINEYVYFNLRNNNHIQLKFEYGDCIVLDEFTIGGEHVEEIGAWDFNDDVVEIN
jgi:hypothetical protein